MKTEHKGIIERAKRLDTPPSMIAHELLVHDLVSSGLFELKNLHSPYSRLNEGQQQEVIDRLTEAATEAAMTAIAIISSRNVTTIPMMMKEVKFNSKQLTLTSIVDAKDPNRHDLIDSAGHLCLLVMAPDDYSEGLDFIQPDRDQGEFPLHASELTGSLFDKQSVDQHPDGAVDEDALYDAGVAFLLAGGRATIASVQRKLKISHDRALTMLIAMEAAGVVSAMDHNGAREVLLLSDPEFAEVGEGMPPIATDDPEFITDPNISGLGNDIDDALYSKVYGEFSYEDVAQLVVLHATTLDVAWLQRRTIIDSDMATSLILLLLENGVIELEAEGDMPIDNTYKVVAKLADLEMNLE
jgi:hypothetical protein